MAVFTIFFCGTKATRAGYIHDNYWQGELVATLAHHMAPEGEYANWIILNGPGSLRKARGGEHLREVDQRNELWVAPGGMVPGSGDRGYGKATGGLFGWGWEENVEHALAVFLNEPDPSRRELPEVAEGIRRRNRMPTRFDVINLVGWSRGGVSCIMFSNAFAELAKRRHELRGVCINIFACDPVPGPHGIGGYAEHRLTLGANVKNYVAVYACDERSAAFACVLPEPTDPRTQMHVYTMPGRHGTIVGNGGKTGGEDGHAMEACYPGVVVRHMAMVCLQRWGTPLLPSLKGIMDDAMLFECYDHMLGQKDMFESMHTHVKGFYAREWRGFYAEDDEGWMPRWPLPVSEERNVVQSDGSVERWSEVEAFEENEPFANRHHYELFCKNWPGFADWLFGRSHGALDGHAWAGFYFASPLPNLYAALKPLIDRRMAEDRSMVPLTSLRAGPTQPRWNPATPMPVPPRDPERERTSSKLMSRLNAMMTDLARGYMPPTDGPFL